MSSTALLFSGQGSQEFGMGRSLAEHSPEVMNLWKRAESISALPLREIYWEGDETAMTNTKALQPALTVVNLALWMHAAHHVQPCAAAGHSLGEFSAFAAAGALPLDDVLRITALRGALMAEADPHGTGAMAAIVKLDQGTVEDIVRQSRAATGQMLLIANYNTPAQLVISGEKDAVDHAVALTKAAKGRGIMLKVSGAFHSPLMADAAKELTPLLQKAHWNKPRFPVYCNVHGKAVTDAHSAQEAALQQMTSSVRWVDTVRAMAQAGAQRWLELAPKQVLGKMVQPCLAELLPQGSSPDVLCVRNEEELASL
jgi:[acyl-carrier-protein] S-malonyltransferase